MSYIIVKNEISRIPVVLVKIYLDFCLNSFGTAPCTATGTPCYNTFFTCKDKTNYSKTSKEYKFTSADAPLPFPGPRPYVLDVQYLPTEIKDNFTISGRVNITLADEPDTDIGIDPYVSQRTSVQGTFWKKLIARNPNYRGRKIEIYEGFLGLEETEFEKKFTGKIENIKIADGKVTIEAIDLLRYLAEIEIPEKINCKLVSDITETDIAITLTTVADLDDSGYVIIGEEIIQYTGKNTSTNQITGCTRGAFNTTPSSHSANDKVGKVRYYAPQNPFDILLEMLTVDADLDTQYINLDEFNYWKSWPAEDIDFSGIITEPTKLSTLYFEIVDLLDCKSWIAENLKITIRRNLPNEPSREYGEITDEKNIIDGSCSVNLNEKSRITRISLYWDKNVLGKIDDVKEYNRLDVAIDADSESENGYGDVKEKKIFCRWLRPGLATEETLAQFITNFLARRFFRQTKAQQIISCSVEIKDLDIHTGDWVKMTTDELLTEDGSNFNRIPFQVIKRERKKEKIDLTLIKVAEKKICFITPSGYPDYTNASESQREYGFISDSEGKINEDWGYFIY